MVMIMVKNITHLTSELLGRLDNPTMFTTIDGHWLLYSPTEDRLGKFGLSYFHWMSVDIKSRRLFNDAVNLLEIGSWR